MQLNYRKAQKTKISSFILDEEQRNQFSQANLYQVYQGEWEPSKQYYSIKGLQQNSKNNSNVLKQQCDVHADRIVQLFCNTDLKIICDKCVLEDHKNHQVYFLDMSHSFPAFKMREIDKYYVQTVLIQQLPLTMYSRQLTAYQRLLVLECQIDALIFQIHQMAEENSQKGECSIANILNLGMKCREFQKRFNECKSVCLTRKEEIHLELMRWVDCEASDEDKLDAEDNENYSDEEISQDQSYAKREPLYIGERLRVHINEYLHSKEYFEYQLTDIPESNEKQVLLQPVASIYNFSKIEEILTQCQQMIADSEPSIFQSSKEEKISQIQLLHDKAHDYKMKHADAWKAEEDSQKRKIRIQNLVELFKICELLKNVVENQILLPIEQEEAKRQEREVEQLENGIDLDKERIREMIEYGYGGGIPSIEDLNEIHNFNSPSKKKKKQSKVQQANSLAITKNEDFEKLRAEAVRLHKEVSNDQKPYIPKQESDSKIIKFKQVPKNQCLYCTRQLSNDQIVASCGPNNSAMIFEYEGFKIQKTLYNETFEVIYCMFEIEGFLVTGHSKGLLMIWDYNLAERVIKYECSVKDPITSILYMKNSILWVALMNGDMLLLRVNGSGLCLEQLNQVIVTEPAKKIYSLMKVSDGRVCVAQDKGFTIWQMINVQSQQQQTLATQPQSDLELFKMQRQNKQTFLEDQVISQLLEYDVNQVLVSTMSCVYFLISIKTNQILHKIQGRGKYCIDLIRVPYYDQMGVKNIYCGIENEFYILIDVENEKTKVLQHERAENQSPWYTGAIFLRNKTDCMVVAEEKKRSIRSFVVNNL
eukprot:403352469